MFSIVQFVINIIVFINLAQKNPRILVSKTISVKTYVHLARELILICTCSHYDVHYMRILKPTF